MGKVRGPSGRQKRRRRGRRISESGGEIIYLRSGTTVLSRRNKRRREGKRLLSLLRKFKSDQNRWDRAPCGRIRSLADKSDGPNPRASFIEILGRRDLSEPENVQRLLDSSPHPWLESARGAESQGL